MTETHTMSEEVSISSTSNSVSVKEPNVESGGDSGFISDMIKKISTTDLLYGVGFCVIILLIIGCYLYYKNKCEVVQPEYVREQFKQEHVREQLKPEHVREQPRKHVEKVQINTIIEETEPDTEPKTEPKVKIIHPKITESSSEIEVVNKPKENKI